jgi:1-deoxy-D-xylulose-5-phosphate synthase
MNKNGFDLELFKKINLRFRELSVRELEILAQKIRSELVTTQSKNGFLGSCLGVVDLTIALNFVFNLKEDLVFWDVGHQTIPQKILQKYIDGCYANSNLQGDVEYTEKETPHYYKRPAQNLSEAIGALIHRDLFKKNYEVIAVIGDRSTSSGQAFEALNHLGTIASKKIIILNDNSDEDAECTSAFSHYLQHQKPTTECFWQHSLFESLGFNYIGPIDGHNFEDLLKTLMVIKNSKEQTPIILHIKTKKGKGYAPAESDQDGLNHISSFDIKTGMPTLKEKKQSGYFACKALIEAAYNDPSIVLISLRTPHIHSPFLAFKDLYPDRYFEVGITESHAMTLTASLAKNGLKPYLILYSSFLHRVLDNAIVDICLKKIPVRIIIDHTKFTGHDFVLDARLFDSSFSSYLPNLVIMSPGCSDDIQKMVDISTKFTGPSIIRLSKTLTEQNLKDSPLEVGKFRILKNGERLAILSYGGRLDECLRIADNLNTNGISTTVVDTRFLKPLDKDSLKTIVNSHQYLISIEENAMGSLSNHILQYLNQELSGSTIVYKPFYISDQNHNFYQSTLDNVLNERKILNDIIKWIHRKNDDLDFISVA